MPLFEFFSKFVDGTVGKDDWYFHGKAQLGQVDKYNVA